MATTSSSEIPISVPSMTAVVATPSSPEALRLVLAAIRAMDDQPIEVLVGPEVPSPARAVVESFGGDVLDAPDSAKASSFWNSAVRAAQGDIIAFFDGFHLPFRDWSTRVLNRFLDQRLGGCTGTTLGPNGQIGWSAFVRSRTKAGRWRAVGLTADYLDPEADLYPELAAPCSAFRRSALLNIGDLDDTFAPHDAAADAGRRIIDCGWRVEHVDGLIAAELPIRLPYPAAVSTTIGGAPWAIAALNAGSAAVGRAAANRGVDGRRPQRFFESRSVVPWARPGLAPTHVSLIDETSASALGTDPDRRFHHVMWPIRCGLDSDAHPPAHHRAAISDTSGALAWHHQIPVSDRVLGEIAYGPTRLALVEEAALLHSIRWIGSHASNVIIEDRRNRPRWPLEELAQLPSDALGGRVREILQATGLSPGDASAIADDLVDHTQFPFPLHDLVARAVTLPAVEGLPRLFQALLGRPQRPGEIEGLADRWADRPSRTALVTNLLASTLGRWHGGETEWMRDIPRLERRGLLSRLFRAFELPPELAIIELYRVILGRQPYGTDHRPHLGRIRGEGNAFTVAAIMMESEEAAARPTRWPPRIGFDARLAERLRAVALSDANSDP